MNQNPSQGPSRFFPFLFIFLFCFVLFSLGVAGVEITRIDVRFALFVEDMTRYGAGLFPTINGQPYADYPVTMTRFAWLASAGGRFLCQWTLALGSILCGSLAVALTWLTGETLHRGAGWAAAALSVMTAECMTSIMGFGIDVPVMAAGALLLYLLTAFPEKKWLPGVFFLLLVLCFCIRGPLGLLLLGAAAGGWILFSGNGKKILIWGATGAAALALCGFAGIRLIHAAGGKELYETFLAWQITSRMAADDLFFYVLDGPVVFSPCTAFGIAAVLAAAVRKKLVRTPLFRLLGFFLFPLILLSIPGCKHLRYMLITIPAFAVAGGLGLCSGFGSLRVRRFLRTVFAGLGKSVWLLAFAAGIVMIAVTSYMMGSFAEWRFRCLALLLFPLCCFFPAKKKGLIRDVLRTAVPAGILIAVFIYPVSSFRERSQEFVRHAEAFRTGRLFFYRIGCDHEDLKYLLHSAGKSEEAVYLYEKPDMKSHYSRMYRIRDLDFLKEVRPGDLVILRKDRKEDLEKDIRARNLSVTISECHAGKLGHREYFAVQLLPERKNAE